MCERALLAHCAVALSFTHLLASETCVGGNEEGLKAAGAVGCEVLQVIAAA